MPRPSKKWSKLSKKLLASNKQFRLTGVIALITVLVVIGAYFILHIHAATCTLGGDANCDGTVNVLDLSIVAGNFGKTSGMTWAQGDFNGDGAVSVIDLSILAANWGSWGTTGTAKCGLTNVAFCETFDSPAGTGNRSGQLNGTLWGASRVTGTEPSDLWASTTTLTTPCGQSTVAPPSDIAICNGQMFDSVNDNYTVTSLAMYPKQPFDFAGRTGKIVFDVSNDTQGSHMAWPELWMSDQPVPDPFEHQASWTSNPRNGFGVRFSGCTDSSGSAATCPRGSPQSVGVDSAVVVNNYVENDKTVVGLDSVLVSQPGQMNHYEVDVSQNQIDVYGTDPFTGAPDLTKTPLRHLATIPNANMTATRGLIWLEDAHYNADKFGTQRIHTFAWDNVGFDGPILPRDLAFDVPDNNVPGTSSVGSTGTELGYDIQPNSSLTLTDHGITGVGQASSALLTFNFYDSTTEPFPIQYAINGHSHSFAWPYPWTNGGSPKTVAIPVSLSELQAGDNTITFTTGNYNLTVMNIDLIMVGAAGTINP